MKTIPAEIAEELASALGNAQSFIQEVQPSDPDDIEVTADIESLSGKIAAALHKYETYRKTQG